MNCSLTECSESEHAFIQFFVACRKKKIEADRALTLPNISFIYLNLEVVMCLTEERKAISWVERNYLILLVCRQGFFGCLAVFVYSIP